MLNALSLSNIVCLRPFGLGGDVRKLDEVGPVENRPSIDLLHDFVKKEKEKKLTLNT